MTPKEANAHLVAHSWRILEHKWRYYVGKAFGVETISDDKYDKIEENYKKLCKALKQKTTAVDMVGFDFERPSCRIVHTKMCQKYNLEPEQARWVG